MGIGGLDIRRQKGSVGIGDPLELRNNNLSISIHDLLK